MARHFLLALRRGIATRPLLKSAVAMLLAPFPHLDARLRAVGSLPQISPADISNPLKDDPGDIQRLSPRAKRIYCELEAAIEQRRKETP